jgi:hypothetical protein
MARRRDEVSRALTISGAAVGPAMGAHTFFAEAFLAVIFNARLGYWMSNPRTDAGDRWVFWPRYMLQEVFSLTSERTPLVNLSDGGHTGDNVGIYPLLERRCQVIIACDAEADAGLSFGSFTEALRHALRRHGRRRRHRSQHDPTRSDDEVEQEPLRRRPHPLSGVPGSSQLADLPEELAHRRRAGTGDELPDDVPDFPHESTADQFFDDAQFESYRALGSHIAEETFASWASDPAIMGALWNEQGDL